jgi:hypothetical protein
VRDQLIRRRDSTFLEEAALQEQKQLVLLLVRSRATVDLRESLADDSIFFPSVRPGGAAHAGSTLECDILNALSSDCAQVALEHRADALLDR